MTDQELQQLTREYAEQNPPTGIKDEVLKRNMIGINAEIFEKFLIWLTKTHCIVSRKDAEAAIANAWHAWPNERPPHNGKYLVVLSYRHSSITKICVRSFRDGDWIFSCKTEIDYWMEIPQLPKHIQL